MRRMASARARAALFASSSRPRRANSPSVPEPRIINAFVVSRRFLARALSAPACSVSPGDAAIDTRLGGFEPRPQRLEVSRCLRRRRLQDQTRSGQYVDMQVGQDRSRQARIIGVGLRRFPVSAARVVERTDLGRGRAIDRRRGPDAAVRAIAARRGSHC